MYPVACSNSTKNSNGNAMSNGHAFWITCLVAIFASGLNAAPPLHEQIDELIEAHPTFDQSLAGAADDATFLRRIYLDLTGTIPSADRVRGFLADSADDKRLRLIDVLLSSPEHARRMQYVFDEMLMERKEAKHVKAKAWRDYLLRSFRDNKPWDELVREMLTVDGSDEKTRAAARFLLDREVNKDGVPRDLGRIFLGRDLECAQCHDHPGVEDYLQRHYYGLSAFVKRSYLVKDSKTGLSSIGEKAEGDVEFTSVFTGETEKTAPRMLDLPPVDDPPVGKEPYKIKPAKNVRSVPSYSRRLQLATAMTEEANVQFRRNIVNRIWALMMGRGLVEPLDMMHSGNPPSHPKLLDQLADSFLKSDYDVRYLLRELALTKTYQRSSQSKQDAAEERQDFSIALLKPLSPEQLAWSMIEATGPVIGVGQPSEQKELSEGDKAQAAGARQADIDAFVKIFGLAGQTTEFDAGARQALFLRNGALLQTWLSAEEGLVARLQKLENEKVPAELYLTVFARLPNEVEVDNVVRYLKSQEDRPTAMRQLTWASLVSAEFRFSH
jgi:hypothetical protein